METGPALPYHSKQDVCLPPPSHKVLTTSPCGGHCPCPIFAKKDTEFQSDSVTYSVIPAAESWCSHVSASMCCSSGFPKGLLFWASDVPESQFPFSLPLMGDEGQRPICHVWAESLRTQMPGVSLVFSKVMHVGYLLGIGSDQRVLLYTPDLGSNHVFPSLSLSLCWKPSLPPPKELLGWSKSSFNFSMRSYRKSQMNFLASPIQQPKWTSCSLTPVILLFMQQPGRTQNRPLVSAGFPSNCGQNLSAHHLPKSPHGLVLGSLVDSSLIPCYSSAPSHRHLHLPKAQQLHAFPRAFVPAILSVFSPPMYLQNSQVSAQM